MTAETAWRAIIWKGSSMQWRERKEEKETKGGGGETKARKKRKHDDHYIIVAWSVRAEVRV